MPVTARPLPRTAPPAPARPQGRPAPVPHGPAAHAPARPPAHAASAAHHGAHGKAAGAHTTHPVTIALIVFLIAGAAAAGLGIVWYFGAGRELTSKTGLPKADVDVSTNPQRPATTFYRDMGDGRVMVLEIDENGTRLKGTVKRTEVPFQMGEHTSSGTAAAAPSDRVQALGSAFR